MNSKRWIKIVLMMSPLCVVFIGSINYVIDPFNIFHTKILKNEFQMNERFMKIEYLDGNYSKYNSYMFGSSRIGTSPPSIINKYIKGAKFYNFNVSNANFYDYLVHLRYFLKRKYNIENIYLQLDVDNMQSYGHSTFDYLIRMHPNIKNESLYLYYISYLTGFFPHSIIGKIKKNLYNNDRTIYHIETGFWEKPDKELKIKANHKRFIQGEPSFHHINKRIFKNTQHQKNVESLNEISNLCKKNNINLIAFTTPLNNNLMASFEISSYLKYLKMIASVMEFYDFSGYNSITLNNENYYEHSHYRPSVAAIIAARVFNDTNIMVPEDFGYLINKTNVDDYLNDKRKEIEDYNLTINIR